MNKGNEGGIKKQKIELRSEEFQEVLGDVPPWILRWGILLIGIIIMVIMIGSAIFKYPDTIQASMTLTGTNPPTALVARISGKLKEINIKDKQLVSNGEYLAVIENPATSKDIQQLKAYILQLNQNLDTLVSLPPKNLNLGSMQPLYSNFYISLFDYYEFKRLQYYIKKILFMKERISQYKEYCLRVKHQENTISEQLQLYRKQYRRDSLLVQRGVLSFEELEFSRNRYLQGYLSLENMQATIQNTEIQITQMQENLLDTEYQYQDKKSTLETQIKTYISQLLAEIQSWEQTFVLVAPIKGQIVFTNYWFKNQNVSTGETIFTIVPQQEGIIIGKAQMPIIRSGKVKVGQKANIRFSNFPDNEYGMVRGIVKNISLVPVNDTQGNEYYSVEIELPEKLKTTYNKRLPYLPEMRAQVEIVTDDISLLERFLMPLRKIWTEGMK